MRAPAGENLCAPWRGAGPSVGSPSKRPPPGGWAGNRRTDISLEFLPWLDLRTHPVTQDADGGFAGRDLAIRLCAGSRTG